MFKITGERSDIHCNFLFFASTLMFLLTPTHHVFYPILSKIENKAKPPKIEINKFAPPKSGDTWTEFPAIALFVIVCVNFHLLIL